MRITRCRRTRTIARSPHVLRACPLPTECGIEDDIHVGKMLVDVAVAGKMGHWCAPAAGVGGAGCDVSRDGGAREKVNVNVLGRPFCGVDTAADGVEAGTERLLVLAHN